MNATAATSLERLRVAAVAWYQGLEARERQVVVIGALLAPILILLIVVLGLHGAVNRLEQRLITKRADLEYVQNVLPTLRNTPRAAAGGESLNAIVDRTARDAGLAGNLTGVDPAGPGQLRVRLEGAPFDTIVGWLLQLQQSQGVAVASAAIDRTATAGRVNATLTLSRP